MKKIVTGICILAILGVGVFAFVSLREEAPIEPIQPEIVKTERQIIGASVQGREIDSYTYGKGETHLMFVGGIHGGYEWNSVLLAYTFIDISRQTRKSSPTTCACQ